MNLKQEVVKEIIRIVSTSSEETIKMFALLLNHIEVVENRPEQGQLNAVKPTKSSDSYSDLDYPEWDDTEGNTPEMEIEDIVEAKIARGVDPMKIFVELAEAPPVSDTFDFANFTLTKEEEVIQQSIKPADINEGISKAIIKIVGKNPSQDDRLRMAAWKSQYTTAQIYHALQKTVQANVNTLRHANSFLKATYPAEDSTGMAPKIR